MKEAPPRNFVCAVLPAPQLPKVETSHSLYVVYWCPLERDNVM